MSAAAIPIIEAMRSRRLLRFAYKGRARLVEPHTYGRDRWRREILCGFQLDDGDAVSVGWRTFVIAELSALQLEPRVFEQPRDGYRRDDGLFAEIVMQL